MSKKEIVGTVLAVVFVLIPGVYGLATCLWEIIGGIFLEPGLYLFIFCVLGLAVLVWFALEKLAGTKWEDWGD